MARSHASEKAFLPPPPAPPSASLPRQETSPCSATLSATSMAILFSSCSRSPEPLHPLPPLTSSDAFQASMVSRTCRFASSTSSRRTSTLSCGFSRIFPYLFTAAPRICFTCSRPFTGPPTSTKAPNSVTDVTLPARICWNPPLFFILLLHLLRACSSFSFLLASSSTADRFSSPVRMLRYFSSSSAALAPPPSLRLVLVRIEGSSLTSRRANFRFSRST
mmetsp:Transcript_800/g.2430  ORF Transcript_800/g.2430 Transcript_800/m.2430 type:complete len:220 (-) Transcript_800:452-1111(-)